MRASFILPLILLSTLVLGQEVSTGDSLIYEYNEDERLVKIKVFAEGVINNRLSLEKMDSLTSHYENSKHTEAYIQALIFSGELALKSGLFVKAKTDLEQSLSLSSEKFDQYYHHYVSACLVLAENAGQVINYAESEKYLTEAIEILENKELTNSFQYANAIRGYSMYNRVMGKFDLALKYGIQAKDLIKKLYGTQNNEYAQATYFLAMTNHNAQNHKKAEQLYLESQKIYEQLYSPDPYYYLAMLSSLGSLYVVVENYPEAEKSLLYAHNQSVKRLGESHPFSGRILYWLGLAKQAQGHAFDDVYKIYKKSLETYENVFQDNHQRVIESKYALANLYVAHGNTEDAIPIYLDVISFYNDFITEYFNYLGESERESFYNLVKDIFEQFTQLSILLSDSHPELAAETMNLQLRYKSLLINTSNQIRRRIMDAGDRKLIELYNDVQQLRQVLGQTISFSDAELFQKRGLKRDSLTNLLDEKDRLLNTYSLYYKNKAVDNRWEAIQEKLGKKDALVEMVRYRTYDYQRQRFTDRVNYAALIIEKKSKLPQVKSFPNGNYLEKQALAAYRNCIKFKLKDVFTYQYFYQPIESALKKKDVIYFSPDGIFHQINLLTLYSPKKKAYLFDKLNIQIVSSGRDLLLNRSEKLSSNLAILIGNPNFKSDISSVKNIRNGIAPLPATEKEVNTISSLLKKHNWREQVFLADNAREETLKDMLKPKLLHIATHGYFNENIGGHVHHNSNPLYRSGLLLSGAESSLYQKQNLRENIILNQEDGILTAYEAMNLNIDNTELIVLSACETGLGEVRNGEGVYGLQRALVVAGARSIIMSLWKVDDEKTSQLMVDFYKNWLGGMEKRTALAKAQEKLMKSHPHPYFWGGFVLIGE